jgi:hypothetical protein
MRRLGAIALGIALAAACGDDENIALDKPARGGDAGADAPVIGPDANDGAPPATPKRTVTLRNPFGNVKASDNLLWDGDFEWHTAFAEQYGWVNALQVLSVSAFEQVRVGTDCRSGLKCGYLTQNQKIAAIGVSPGKEKVSGSVWIKPPMADCTAMFVALIACDYGVDPDLPLVDADNVPDAEGWCHYEGVSEPRQRSTCLVVSADFTEGEAIVDDAVVRAAWASAAPSARSLPPERRASLDEARAAIRKALAPRPPRPTRIERALEHWRGRTR